MPPLIFGCYLIKEHFAETSNETLKELCQLINSFFFFVKFIFIRDFINEFFNDFLFDSYLHFFYFCIDPLKFDSANFIIFNCLQ